MENDQANTLLKLGSAQATINNWIMLQETLPKKNEEKEAMVMCVKKASSWMDLIVTYLKKIDIY